MEGMKVAVITRTKDRPAFLTRALKSVGDQAYDDYVHVIVNDGGDKDTVERIVGLAEHGDKIRLFHRETASGAPDTIFTESIDRVDSTYIAIHDDDDTWHPEFLSRAVAALEAGAKGVVTRADKVIESVDEGTIHHIRTVPYMPDMSVVSLYRQCIDNQLTPIAFVYRREAYEDVGKYDPALPVVGDWEFGIRFLAKYDVEYLDPGFALAFYHHRKESGDNSFAKHNHRKYVTQVANAYLRTELAKNRLGLGYIISGLKYEQDVRHGIVKRLVPKGLLSKIKR